MSKWALSIVPLIGIFQGKPAVQDLDVRTSAALMMTGALFGVYSLVVCVNVESHVKCCVDHWIDCLKTKKLGRFLAFPVHTRGNAMLALVNFTMAAVNGYNVVRRFQYDRKQKRLAEGQQSS